MLPRRDRIVWISLTLIALSGAAGGCGRGQVTAIDDTEAEALKGVYGPRKLEVLPFTKIRSFDDDAIPDGVEVSLRPLDAMGDPTKIYGTFIFELYQYRDASGQRAGQRLETWSQAVRTVDDQKRFWDRVTSTYIFQLTWEGGEFPQPNKKYLLAVSYQAPGEKRLFAEYPFEFRVDRLEAREGVAATATPMK